LQKKNETNIPEYGRASYSSSMKYFII